MIKRLLLFSLLITCAIFEKIAAQPIRNTYKFYNSLSTTEADCAPDLVPVKGLNTHCIPSTAATSGKFITDNLSAGGPERIVYHNNLNWGLRYENPIGVIAKTYTVQMYIKVTNFNQFYTRIIDFSDAGSDDGIYFTNFKTPPPATERCLNFYPNGNFGVCPFFNNYTYYLLTITRNDQTKKIDIYVNDQLFTTYNDVLNFYTSNAGKPVHIFRDDPLGFACEDGEANFAYLSFANYYSTQADVTAVYNNINTIASTADFTLSPSSGCMNKDVIITYKGDIPPAATGYSFNWDWNGGQVISGSGRGPYTIKWNSAGNKTIQLSITGSACSKTITNSKQLYINAAGSSKKDTTICEGNSFEGYTTTGTFIKNFITASGCDSTRIINLTVVPPRQSFVDTTICSGTSFEGYSTTGQHIKTFGNNTGCDSTRIIKLTVIPSPSSFIDTTICEGSSFEGYTQAGTFTKTFDINERCDSIRTVKLTIQSKHLPDLGNNNIVCIGDSLVLSPGNFDSYVWQDGSTQKRYVVKKAGLYSVVVTDKCTVANAEIQVSESNCKIYFPNAFTPNKDGQNETFRILHSGYLSQYSLTIYNRFGEKIFETHNPQTGWDGKYTGKDADAGTYVWYCSFKRNAIDNLQILKGTFILIR